jgi:hypothetical protein
VKTPLGRRRQPEQHISPLAVLPICKLGAPKAYFFECGKSLERNLFFLKEMKIKKKNPGFFFIFTV